MRQIGFFRTIWRTFCVLGGLLQEQMPERKRAKYDDLDFDWRHLVDTTRGNLSFHVQAMCALTGHEYWPTEPWLFEQIMDELPIDFQQFTFIDMGSGKGRILMMASSYPFRRIIGVELIPSLNEIAQENLARYPGEGRRSGPVELVRQDARDFQFPAEPLFVYLFNPFPEPVFAAVLENLRRSAEGSSRLIYVAYRYLEFEHLLANCGWLEKIAGTEQWAIYRNQTFGHAPKPQKGPRLRLVVADGARR